MTDFSLQVLRAVAAAGEKGIESVYLLMKFPDKTNAMDIYQCTQKLRDDGLISFDVKYRRIPHGGGMECIQRYIVTEAGRAALEGAGGEP